MSAHHGKEKRKEKKKKENRKEPGAYQERTQSWKWLGLLKFIFYGARAMTIY